MSVERLRVVLLAQGDEITSGHTVDTNSSWLAERLVGLGFVVVRIMAVGDVLGHIVAVVREAWSQASVVIGTGGLGPTADDLTAAGLAAAFNLPLEEHAGALANVEAVFRVIGRPPTALDRKQALLPRGATPLVTQWGTAPGIRLEHAGTVGYFLPGVPREMRAFWEHHLEPELRALSPVPPGRLIVFRCMGLAEARLQQRVASLPMPEGVVVGYKALLPENQLRLRLPPGLDRGEVARLVEHVREALGPDCFGIDSGPIAEVVGCALAERGATVATAESCTAGRLSAAITSVAGSSGWFLEGAAVYANAAKVRTCGVPPALLEAHGAVSEPVARALAEGMRARVGSTYALSTTGVAGPGGGTAAKPVGTVHIALAHPAGTEHRLLKLHGDREQVTTWAAMAALDLLRRHLQGPNPALPTEP